ncbi:MAG: hypothetical protein J0L85_01390 [Zoogloea sp.]|nr:hypothetical protein [Zoogloea sp.]
MKELVSMTLVAALILSGCGTINRAGPEEGSKSVQQIDQAASLHTSITSITPWEDIKDKLKPGFVLSANDALTKSIPTTLVRLDRVLDILKFQLALTPSITKESSTITTSSGSGKEPTTAADSKREKSSPELPTVAPPTGLSASAPVSVSGPDTSADALLQYQTAANLLRDIAVLNSEIDNVSRRTGQDAFLTRIQVSVMPLRRGLGYDVYANLSMFASSGSFDPNTGKRTVGELLPAVPLVVPILSTDSLQATRRSNSSIAQRELALALNLLKGFGSVGASVGRSQSNENDAEGVDLESVVTVGRLSDNTIRIRMGADPLPGGGFGMVPRTFNISAVVFLPKTAKQLYYVSRLSLHHVLDGTELSTHRTPSYWQGLEAISKGHEYAFDRKLTPGVLENHLNDFAFHGDFQSFVTQLQPLAAAGITDLERQREMMYVWAELIALNRQSRFANSVIDVPRPADMEWPVAEQLVAYTSDNKGVSVTLGLGKNLRAEAIDARLVLGACAVSAAVPAKLASAPVVKPGTTSRAKVATAKLAEHTAAPCRTEPMRAAMLQASSVTTSKDGRTVALQFPPVAQIQSLDASATTLLPYGVVLQGLPGASAAAAPPTYVFVAAIPPRAAPDKSDELAVAIVPDGAIIRANKDDEGSIGFTVQAADKKDLKILVRGFVTSFKDSVDKVVPRKGAGWMVADGGHYVLGLKNLTPSADVRIELVSQPDASKKPTLLHQADFRVERHR